MNTNLAYRDDFRREELIGGKPVMMAPRPAIVHSYTASNIYTIFANYLRGKRCTPLGDGVDLYLSETEHYIPDMMVVCDPEKIRRTGVYGAPDLVVEVLSPSSIRYDRGPKMQTYARCGVREYWIVSPGERSVEQYFLQDGRLELHDVFHDYDDDVLEVMSEEDRAAVVTEFRCSLFDDLSIRLEDVFDRVR